MMRLFTKVLDRREFYSANRLIVKAVRDDFVLADYYRENHKEALMEGNFPRRFFDEEVKKGEAYTWYPSKDGSMKKEDFERIVE
ncbi:MAG: hypothetical protein AABW80_02295 [Nanoarchaeota archaeon]